MKTKLSSFLSAALLCASVTADVYAGELVKCEKRTAPARSKISIEVEKVKPNALYTAIVRSGNKKVSSIKAANAFGKLKYGFDSNKKDIRAGKRAIPAKFIVNEIDAWVYDALGNVIARGSDTVCTIK